MKILCLLFAGLAGCALAPGWHWERPGAASADYAEDERICKVETYAFNNGEVTRASVRRMHACMEARGWRKVND